MQVKIDVNSLFLLMTLLTVLMASQSDDGNHRIVNKVTDKNVDRSDLLQRKNGLFPKGRRTNKMRKRALKKSKFSDVAAMPSKEHSWFGFELWKQPVNDDIDDVIIGYDFQDIDGNGGILGFAGPIYIRHEASSITTISGVMKFDIKDFSDMPSDDAELIIIHEMGHVLGIGTFWDYKCGRNCVFGDTTYTCEKAKDEYKALNLGDELSLQEGVCGHWAESTFQHNTKSELMTPYFEANNYQPISRVTIGALADLGYEVDFKSADSWEDKRGLRLRGNGAQGNDDAYRNDISSKLAPTKTFTIDQSNVLRPKIMSTLK